jgi:2-iminoacetate synthase
MRVDDGVIARQLARAEAADAGQVRDTLARARAARGLTGEEASVLFNVDDRDLLADLFAAAREVKEGIYGRRLVLFAPLYISNLCANECVYCAFRARNPAVARRALSREEIEEEVRALVTRGHKRVLVVAGESYPREGLDYVLDAIDAVYAVREGPGEVRRVNVNVAPLEVEEFRRLKERHIGTYQLFQETYHRPTYERVHLAGPKRDFDWRVTTMDRALEAGIDDVGIGVLFGLHDWRYEVLALLQHVRHLERRFGVGPHTISVPRLEPAAGSDFASRPPYPVSDEDFRKLVAILRLTVPYTGIILSTRETPAIRRQTFALGVSQISAGSRTNPGGYAVGETPAEAQFSLGDHRPLDEVIRDVAALGYIPSFCTACYRLGRTGRDFMDLAKPGDIKTHCAPNALGTFMEYLLDYASAETREVGEKLVADVLDGFDGEPRARATRIVDAVRGGRRDVFV